MNNLDIKIFARTSVGDDIKELVKSNDHIVKFKLYNISYENVNVEEAKISDSLSRNSYYIAALLEFTMKSSETINIVAEDVYLIQNSGKILVTFYDNYEFISKEKIYDNYQELVDKFRKSGNVIEGKKLTNQYLQAYRDEIEQDYKQLFNFYKTRNREFNQNTLENRRYMRIRKTLSRNILKELLISRTLFEYRTKQVI